MGRYGRWQKWKDMEDGRNGAYQALRKARHRTRSVIPMAQKRDGVRRRGRVRSLAEVVRGRRVQNPRTEGLRLKKLPFRSVPSLAGREVSRFLVHRRRWRLSFSWYESVSKSKSQPGWRPFAQAFFRSIHVMLGPFRTEATCQQQLAQNSWVKFVAGTTPQFERDYHQPTLDRSAICIASCR